MCSSFPEESGMFWLRPAPVIFLREEEKNRSIFCSCFVFLPFSPTPETTQALLGINKAECGPLPRGVSVISSGRSLNTNTFSCGEAAGWAGMLWQESRSSIGGLGRGRAQSECPRSLHHMPFSRLSHCQLVCLFHRKGDQEEE